MEHANVGAVRTFLTAWFQGDADGWRPLATEDVVIRMARLDGQPVRVVVEDVVADDRYAVAVVHVASERPEGVIALSYACAQRINEHGKIVEVWNLSHDRVAHDRLTRPDSTGTEP